EPLKDLRADHFGRELELFTPLPLLLGLLLLLGRFDHHLIPPIALHVDRRRDTRDRALVLHHAIRLASGGLTVTWWIAENKYAFHLACDNPGYAHHSLSSLNIT